jgi:VWFA-related protein
MRTAELRTAAATLALLGNLVFPAAQPMGRAAQSTSSDSQDAQQLPQSQQPLRVQTSLVNLFATVRDGHHALVADLAKDDFHIYEDGQEQKVAFFSKEVTLPITLGILIDTSGSELNMLSAEQDAMSLFIHRVTRKGDESMVMSFDSDVDLLSDFTEDSAMLERAIRRARVNVPSASGPISQANVTGTALFDAIYLACREKLSSEAGRKAIVIVTDAEDNQSKVKLEEAVEAAQRADTVIHIILVADRTPGRTSGIGVSIARKLTEDTGGRVIEVRNEKDLNKAFDIISEELRSQYTLGYYPTNPTHDGSFRKLKVETSRSGLKVLARRGYYAPKG